MTANKSHQTRTRRLLNTSGENTLSARGSTREKSSTTKHKSDDINDGDEDTKDKKEIYRRNAKKQLKVGYHSLAESVLAGANQLPHTDAAATNTTSPVLSRSSKASQDAQLQPSSAAVAPGAQVQTLANTTKKRRKRKKSEKEKDSADLSHPPGQHQTIGRHDDNGNEAKDAAPLDTTKSSKANKSATRDDAMADRLTQIQDCLDQLATQMFASLHYVSTHHSSSPIEGQPSRNSYHSNNKSSAATPGTPGTRAASQAPGTPAAGEDGGAEVVEEADQDRGPDSPAVFAATLRELSRDLVIKEQQIEFLVNSLPGITASRAEQEERLKALERELQEVDARAVTAKEERDQLVERVEEVMLRLHRVY